MAASDTSTDALSGEERAEPAGLMEEIQAALRGLQFGSVQIIVQDGVVMQIDRIEKRRVHRVRTPRS